MSEPQDSEAPRERIRLPSREEIRTSEDRQRLQEWADHVHGQIAHMETDLEFRSDGRADGEWEHRCRRALAAHKIVRGQLLQRIAQLGRVGAKTQWQQDEQRSQANKDRSLLNREVQEQAALNALERKRQLLEASHLDVERKRVALAQKLSFLHVFRGVAFDLLPRETYDQLNAEAAQRQSAAVLELAAAEPGKEST